MKKLEPPNSNEIKSFFNKLIELTEEELNYEEEESSILFSNSSFKEIELKGLCLSGLVATNISIGLGGKTLITLERSTALSITPILPSHHTFRSGDIIVIRDNSKKDSGNNNSNTSKDLIELNGVVSKVTDTKIVIALKKDDLVDEVIPERIRILKVSNPTTFTRQISTLKSVLRQILPTDDSDIHSPSNSLISILLGLQSPTFTPNSIPTTFYDSTLNPVQRSTVDSALGADQLFLIHGPPGTGKTSTLIEIIRQLVVNQNLRVLVCGASNLSVDNILLRLSASTVGCPPIPLTRIGHPARVMSSLVSHTLDSQSLRTNSSEILVGIKEEMEDIEKELLLTKNKRIKGKERRDKVGEKRELRKEYRQRESGVVKEVLARAKVVLATCHGSGNRLLEKETFDVVIIDEAAQAVEPSCWISALKGKKLILAGDHLQLPPTIKSTNPTNKPQEKVKKDSKKVSLASTDATASDVPLAELNLTSTLKPSPTLELTLFSRLMELYGPSISRMLTTQYRFNSSICSFPSITLYNKALVPDSAVSTRKLSDLNKLEGIEIEPDEDLDEPVVFIDTAGTGCFERSGSSQDNSGEKVKGGVVDLSKCNENEATLVVNYVTMLVSFSLPFLASYHPTDY